MSKYLKPPSLSLEVDAGAALRLRGLAVMLMESSSSTDRAKRRDGSISAALNVPPNGRVCSWMQTERHVTLFQSSWSIRVSTAKNIR